MPRSKIQRHTKGRRKVTRTVFAVGDAKQSIFSFQGVEQSKFAQMHRYFKQRVESVQNRWCSVELDISFRSVDAILSCVDATFQDPKAYKGLRADGMPPSRHKAFRSNYSGIVELWPLATLQEQDNTTQQHHSSIHLAMAIAQTVRSWLDQKERLHIYNRLIRPGDIMVLVQRRSDFMDHLVRAFKDREIPVSGIDRIVLTKHIAVMDLMVFAQFLLLPEDDLALATLLKSPLIGFNDEKLFTVCYGRKSTVWASLLEKQTNDPESMRVCQYLHEWLSIVDSITPYHLFSRILRRPCPRDTVSGWHAMLSRLGHEIIDPLEELLNISLFFEQAHVPSLQSFLAWFMGKESSIKREYDQDEQALNMVRLMTVHGAKGLQAPIVFIPDTVYVPQHYLSIVWPTDNDSVDKISAEIPPLFIPNQSLDTKVCNKARQYMKDQRAREYRRLLYVALTRAEERLYICGWHNKRDTGNNKRDDTPKEESWYQIITHAMMQKGTEIQFTIPTSSSTSLRGQGWRLCDKDFIAKKTPDIPDHSDSEGSLAQNDDSDLSWLRIPVSRESGSLPLIPSQLDVDELPVNSPIDRIDPYR